MLWCKLIVLIISLTSHGDCRNPRIARGRDATIEEFPYQASIQYYRIHLCGGAIISEKHILTAGHCVFEDSPPFNFSTVVTGTSYVSSGKLHEVANITIHPKFRLENARYIYDIAVIELKDRIVFDASQQKINLPKSNFEVGQKANLTGWGLLSDKPFKKPRVLQALETELISIEECEKTIPIQLRLYNNEVCVKKKNDSGACERDSGSPLAANGELVGIVSWGRNLGRSCAYTVPVVNSNVYKFKDFIASAMK